MSREILFRAVSQLDGNWVYGSLIKYDYERPNMEDLSKPHIESSYDICRKESDWCFSYKNVPVFKETIGQFTGLTDKNGTKIFEGDILKLKQPKDETEYIAKVEFGNPNGNYNWGWQLVFIKPFNINSDILCWVEMECVGVDCVVIGNIYDNPELLKED